MAGAVCRAGRGPFLPRRAAPGRQGLLAEPGGRTPYCCKEKGRRLVLATSELRGGIECEGLDDMGDDVGDEGFSLVDSKNWLKIVRRMDCLLFGTTIKNKSRMFRIQFGGESKEQALEHCCNCVQNLSQYVTVQMPEGIIQELHPRPGPWAGGSQGKDCAKRSPVQHGSHQNMEQQRCVAASTGTAEERTSVMQLAQSILASEELPFVYEQSAWGVEELGPFLRLCLMDQNFPAFVDEVEKELKKLTGLRN
nr:meiotic recombination protein REC114 [Marmota flaviventris]